MPKPFIAAFLGGLLTATLFIGTSWLRLGFMFMFLPTLPILSLGLSIPGAPALAAVFIAAAIITIITGTGTGLFFILMLGLPAWYITRLALLWQPGNQKTPSQWFPVGLIMLRLTLCACAFSALIILYFSLQQESLPAMLSRYIHEAFSNLGDEYKEAVDTLAGQWSFLIFSLTVWLWGVTLYAHAWLASRALVHKSLQIRPDFTVRVFAMPHWMLTLLVICALASLIGSESMRFAGKTSLVSLMLPYFFLGLGLMHEASKTWPNRRFFLFFIYFVLAALLWPVLAVSAVGLWHHVKTLNKHLSSDMSSSRD